MGIAIDITERLITEEELKKARKNTGSILENMTGRLLRNRILPEIRHFCSMNTTLSTLLVI